MTHFWHGLLWQALRSGEWLTAARMRGYSLILLALSVLVFAGWIAVSDGLIDRNGQPIGTDFSNVYAAGTLTWQGRSAEAYVPALQHAAEKAVFEGRDVPFYGWHYPPFFFAVAVLVAAIPYAGAGLVARNARRQSRLAVAQRCRVRTQGRGGPSWIAPMSPSARRESRKRDLICSHVIESFCARAVR